MSAPLLLPLSKTITTQNQQLNAPSRAALRPRERRPRDGGPRPGHSHAPQRQPRRGARLWATSRLRGLEFTRVIGGVAGVCGKRRDLDPARGRLLRGWRWWRGRLRLPRGDALTLLPLKYITSVAAAPRSTNCPTDLTPYNAIFDPFDVNDGP